MNLKKFWSLASICCVAVFTKGQSADLLFDTTNIPEEIDVENMVATFRAMYETRFIRLDIDEDGYVSKDEYLFLSRIPNNEAESSKKNGEDSASSTEPDDLPPPGSMPLDIAEFEFRSFDANEDERISREEMMAIAEYTYTLDVNEDGKITRSEFEEIYRTRIVSEKGSNEAE